MVTVPKPTQVGKMSILRRARQLSLRTRQIILVTSGEEEPLDVKLRGVSIQGPQRNGPGDCLSKTQHYANSSKRKYMV